MWEYGDKSLIKIFGHYFHRRTLSQIFFDFSLVVAVVVGSSVWRAPEHAWNETFLLTAALLLAGGMLAINAALGFYQQAHTRSPGQSRARAVMSLIFTMGLAYLIFTVAPIGQDIRSILATSVVAVVAFVLMHRVYVAHSTPQSLMRQRILIFGSGSRAKMVGKSLQRSDPNVDLVGYFASPKDSETEISARGLLSGLGPLTPQKSLTDVVIEERVDEIVVAVSERRGGSMPLRELLDCKLQGVRVVDIATHFEKTLGQIRLDAVSAGWLIFGDGFQQGLIRTVVKRLFDIVCAAILIVVASPIMLITALLLLLEGGGPILYLQERVGLNGRLFNVVKFRSMRTDAEKDGQPRWAAAQDDRVTKVGRVIRKLRIDELPQLFSVLNGDMSLVGPRPERAYFVDKLTQEIPYFAVRQSVKPGVTGWAQVRYHYGASVEDSAEKLQYDLYYVKNHSLFLDLIILFETIGVVLTAKGAQ